MARQENRFEEFISLLQERHTELLDRQFQLCKMLQKSKPDGMPDYQWELIRIEAELNNSTLSIQSAILNAYYKEEINENKNI